MKSSDPEASSSPEVPLAFSTLAFAASIAAAVSLGHAPLWSCPPERSAASVLSARQLTQWPWPSSERTSVQLLNGSQTLMVRSCEPE